MKVYAGTTVVKGKSIRTIVAARSQKEVASLLGISVSHMRDYWSVTGNEVECKVALTQPGVVMYASSSMVGDFVPRETKDKK